MDDHTPAQTPDEVKADAERIRTYAEQRRQTRRQQAEQLAEQSQAIIAHARAAGLSEADVAHIQRKMDECLASEMKVEETYGEFGEALGELGNALESLQAALSLVGKGDVASRTTKQ